MYLPQVDIELVNATIDLLLRGMPLILVIAMNSALCAESTYSSYFKPEALLVLGKY